MREPGGKADLGGREIESFELDILSLRSLSNINVEMLGWKKMK